MPACDDFSLGFSYLPIIPPPRRELRWSTQLPSPLQLKPGLKTWLLDAGSLTAKLLKLSHGKFRVQVLQQVHLRASRSEALALGIGLDTCCLVREVILCGNDEPWVFARSVLPLTSLIGPLRHLRKQGNRPLGAFLFSQPQLKRSPIALSFINRHHAYVPDEYLCNASVWGRRSIFSVNNKPMLVSEVFLPEFPGSKE